MSFFSNLGNLGNLFNQPLTYTPSQPNDSTDYAVLLLTSHGNFHEPEPQSREEPILDYNTAIQNRFENVTKINAVKCGMYNMLSANTVNEIRSFLNESKKNFSFQEASSFLPELLSAIDTGKGAQSLLGNKSFYNPGETLHYYDPQSAEDTENKEYNEFVLRHGKYELFQLPHDSQYFDKYLTISHTEKYNPKKIEDYSTWEYDNDFVLFSDEYSREPILLYESVKKFSGLKGFTYGENNDFYSIKISDLLDYIKETYQQINKLIIIDLTCGSGVSQRMANYIRRMGIAYGGRNKKNRKTKGKKTKGKKEKVKNKALKKQSVKKQRVKKQSVKKQRIKS